jgi:hypothetical protein
MRGQQFKKNLAYQISAPEAQNPKGFSPLSE